MELEELQNAFNKQFKELTVRLEHMDHVQGNLANVVNLYVEQKEQLNSNILYLITKALNVIESREVEITKAFLNTCLKKLATLQERLEKKLADIDAPPKPAEEKKEEDNEE